MHSTEDFIEAGLFDPDEDAGTGRLELLGWLSNKGFSLDAMVDALAADSLGSIAGDRRLVPGERLTRAQAIGVAAVDGDRFDRWAMAFGFVPVVGSPAGEIGFTREEARSIGLIGAMSSMFSDDEATSYLRVVGGSLSRIADAAVSLFLSDVESPMLLDGSSELDLAVNVHDAVGLLDGFAQQLDPILRRQVLQAIERSRRTTIERHERFRYRYAVGFVDLVGFTGISAGMDAQSLSRFLRDFEGRAYDVVTSAGARVVKLIGDEVMFVADDPGAACAAASELMSGFGAEDERVLPRGGLAYGDVLVRGGDYYGSVVNLASRLANEAVPQELLVTEELAEASSTCDFEPAGRRMVKGFDEPVSVRSLTPR